MPYPKLQHGARLDHVQVFPCGCMCGWRCLWKGAIACPWRRAGHRPNDRTKPAAQQELMSVCIAYDNPLCTRRVAVSCLRSKYSQKHKAGSLHR